MTKDFSLWQLVQSYIDAMRIGPLTLFLHISHTCYKPISTRVFCLVKPCTAVHFHCAWEGGTEGVQGVQITSRLGVNAFSSSCVLLGGVFLTLEVDFRGVPDTAKIKILTMFCRIFRSHLTQIAKVFFVDALKNFPTSRQNNENGQRKTHYLLGTGIPKNPIVGRFCF